RNRAHDGKPGVPVEQRVAHNGYASACYKVREFGTLMFFLFAGKKEAEKNGLLDSPATARGLR
ncbi:MAG TPA: hypothetical protein PLI07_15095, partial [Candidatus Hydrogenedentes bacterium]|nr:hypothetical protein [Candidatus Hydrogenedentota bacterium]